MKRRLILLSFCVIQYFISSGQIENKNIFPTPNAASLGQYGQVDVDYFNGLPNIDIPIYNFQSRSLSIPIHLTYHGGGVKPSERASWVGIGWSLQAGGVINRVQNDLPDELVDRFFGPPYVPRGFFYNYNHLSTSSWASSDSLIQVENWQKAQINAPTSSTAHQRIDYAPDEFQFNFLGMSGSLFMGQDGAWHLKSKQGVNFNVTTEIGPYVEWTPTRDTTLSPNFPTIIRNCLTKFILTGPDGTQYSFGAEPATNLHNNTFTYIYGYFSNPDSTSIEFNRVGGGNGQSGDGTDGRDGGTVPVTWYLTKIKSITGDSIVLSYKKNGYQIISSTNTFGSFSQCPACSPVESYTYGAGDDVYILDGLTLASITGANGSVQFKTSKANMLDYQLLGEPTTPSNKAWTDGSNNGLFWIYNNDVFQSIPNPSTCKSTFMQLDTIAVTNNYGARLQTFQLNYISSATNRLFLNALRQIGSDQIALPPYTFTYNNINGLDKLPYSTLNVDHWGYYNGINPFLHLFSPSTVPSAYDRTTQSLIAHYYTYYSSAYDYAAAFDSGFNAIYTANRAPNPDSMQLGVLTQITYPTGGTTQFTWEPNTYSKYIGQGADGNNITVQNLDSTYIGAGLRIRQIQSQAGYNSPVLTKRYSYDRDYINNHITSGVLNSPRPLYVDTYISGSAFFYRCWSNNSLLPFHYTNGSPVTYTKVTEVETDGGYKVFTYSNHDNGYLDQTPTSSLTSYFAGINPLLQKVNATSMELERGLLLNEATYNAINTQIKNITYLYNPDSTRFNNSIRKYLYDRKFTLSGAVLSFDGNGFLSVSSGPAIYYGDIVTSLNVHIEYPFLKRQITTNYDQDGNNPMTDTSTYTYDGLRNKKSESFVSSKGELLSKNYNYANDLITGLDATAQQGQSGMVNAGMSGIPLETLSSRKGSQTDHSRIDYTTYYNSNNLIVPNSSFLSSYGQSLDTNTHYVNFDSKGNVLEYITRNGIPTSFEWGYNQAYPTARVVNAHNTVRNYFVPWTTWAGDVLTWVSGATDQKSITVTSMASGNISVEGHYNSQPDGKTYSFNYSLSGPVNQSGTLCASGCSNPSSATFTNMPAGAYTLSVTPSSNGPAPLFFMISYPVIVDTPATSGDKNYFYDGFEENNDTKVVSGQAHTGSKYWGYNTYTTSFTPSDNSAYRIEWWNLSGGSWQYNQQQYTAGMVLTGPVDDVRIFPANALMSTYTYQPMVGMTSEIDPKGFTTYYSYDPLGRLTLVRDKDNNIIKRYCYNLAGQTQSCPFTK